MSLQLTERAAQEVRTILEQQNLSPETTFLRLGARGGGCSGFSYALDLTDAKGEQDEEFESHGIKVVCDPSEMWPLPWSLRRFDRVGYWTDAGRAGGSGGAAIVIASPDQAAKLEPLLNGAYVSEYYGLRPEVPLTISIRRDLWDRFVGTRK